MGRQRYQTENRAEQEALPQGLHVVVIVQSIRMNLRQKNWIQREPEKAQFIILMTYRVDHS